LLGFLNGLQQHHAEPFAVGNYLVSSFQEAVPHATVTARRLVPQRIIQIRQGTPTANTAIQIREMWKSQVSRLMGTKLGDLPDTSLTCS
jgi:hypothetical protein